MHLTTALQPQRVMFTEGIARAVGFKRLSGGIALIAIRYSEEAGELVNHHIDIHIYEEDTQQEADPVTKLQRPGTSCRSEAS